MTADRQIIDIALDRVLAASPDPIMPTDLASRVTAQVTSERQRRIRGPFKARRMRRASRTRRVRRPVILGTIGGGLLAVSAVAAALVSDGPIDFAQIAKPVIELFVPDSPTETATVERPATAPSRAAADAPSGGAVVAAEPAAMAARPGWRERQLRRALALRQLLTGQQGRPDPAISQDQRPRFAPRPALQAAPIRTDNVLTPAQRARILARTQSLTPTQRQRLETLRERRNQAAPIALDGIPETQRGHIATALRNRLASEPAQRRPATASSAPLDLPDSMPPSVVPAANSQDINLAPSGSLPSMILDNTPPGPEPMQLPDTRPDLSSGDIPAANSARRAAMLERMRAAQAAQRARAAVRRCAAPPPRRPRIPRRPR